MTGQTKQKSREYLLPENTQPIKNFSLNTKIDKKNTFANNQAGFGLYAPILTKKTGLSN